MSRATDPAHEFDAEPPPSGRQFALAFGDQRAVVVEVGGGLRGSQRIDDAHLLIPGGATLSADARGIPDGRHLPVVGTSFDFLVSRRIGTTALDTAYTDLQADADGVTRVSLSSPGEHPGVTVWMDGTHPFVMVYTGDTLSDAARRRRGIAIEPMTCAPDAFNSGLGLRVLQPDEHFATVWGISPSGPGA